MSARSQMIFDGCQARRIPEQNADPRSLMVWRGLAEQFENNLVALDRAVAQVREEQGRSEANCTRTELSEPWPSSGWHETPVPREQIDTILREAFPLPQGGSFTELLRLID